MVSELSLQKLAEEKLKLWGETFWSSFDNQKEDEKTENDKTKEKQNEKNAKHLSNNNKITEDNDNKENDENDEEECMTFDFHPPFSSSSVCADKQQNKRKKKKNKKKRTKGLEEGKKETEKEKESRDSGSEKLEKTVEKKTPEEKKKDALEEFKKQILQEKNDTKTQKNEEHIKKEVSLKPRKDEMKYFLSGVASKMWAEKGNAKKDEKEEVDFAEKQKKNEDTQFTEAVQQIRDLVLPHLDRHQKRQYEQMRNKLLGIQPDKSLKAPYWLLLKQKQNFKKKLEERAALEKELGVKMYVGSSRNIQDAMKEHKKKARQVRKRRELKEFENFGMCGRRGKKRKIK